MFIILAFILFVFFVNFSPEGLPVPLLILWAGVKPGKKPGTKLREKMSKVSEHRLDAIHKSNNRTTEQDITHFFFRDGLTEEQIQHIKKSFNSTQCRNWEKWKEEQIQHIKKIV